MSKKTLNLPEHDGPPRLPEGNYNVTIVNVDDTGDITDPNTGETWDKWDLVCHINSGTDEDWVGKHYIESLIFSPKMMWKVKRTLADLDFPVPKGGGQFELDSEKLKGLSAEIKVVHRPGKEGKVYVNIDSWKRTDAKAPSGDTMGEIPF